MTLHTKVAIHGKPDRREVFDFCRALIGATESRFTEDAESISNACGQGFPAWLWVDGPDEQKRFDHYDEKDDAVEVPFDPPSFCRVHWDTAYGYRGPDGETCGGLHARLVEALGLWCSARGLEWSWFNEFTCEWHRGPEGLAELGRAGTNASAWFRDVVAPAIGGAR